MQSRAAQRALRPARAQVLGLRSLKPYTPDFKTAFEHFCIHPGGKTVIEGVGSQARRAPCASLAVHALHAVLPRAVKMCSRTASTVTVGAPQAVQHPRLQLSERRPLHTHTSRG